MVTKMKQEGDETVEIELRRERPEDYRETEEVIRAAFWNHFAPGCDEHYLLHVMRGCPAFLPELDIVAVFEGRIVGNVDYTRAAVLGDDGAKREVLALGPIAVLPEFQGRGVGGKLIGHTKALACKMGYEAIFLYGDPEYYGRHGFVPAERFGIRTADDMYAAAHQVLVLREHALDGIRGRYVEDSVFEFDRAASEAFDRTFPYREKVSGTPSQKRFEQVVAMRRAAL